MSEPTSEALHQLHNNVRAEAESEPDAVHTGPVTKETQIIAIYGKGGIGKSFTLANLSHMMAQQGKKVLLIGCDPKSDTTSLLFGGKACPTILEVSSKKKLAGEAVEIGDVCFKRGGVFAMELGGPEVGRGCGGRGIIHGFEISRSWASMTGALTSCCSTSWATWCAAASACRLPATCARR
jgi:chlorophyllide a reductase subunit X